MFPNLVKRSKIQGEIKPRKKTFVGIMQTSDVLGNPDEKVGNVNVFSNGGRLQPGCYSNEDDIEQRNLFLALLDNSKMKFFQLVLP